MKKLLVVLICALMVLGSTACEKKAPPTLTFWGHQNDAWNASYRKLADEFTKLHPEITIGFEFFPYDEYEAKTMASLINKDQGADIYEIWGGWGVDFAPTGALAPMSDEIAAMIRSEFFAPTYGALEFEGKIYGFPLEFNIESGAMLVNNNLAKEHDIKIPTTWDEMIVEAKKVVAYEGDNMVVKGFDFVNWDSVPYTFTAMILSSGGNYMDASGNFTFNTKFGQKAYQTLYDLVMVDKVTDITGLTGGDDMEGYQQLFADKVLFAPRGPWVISEGELEFELSYGEDFDYVAMPWFGSEAKFASETGWAIAINGGTEKSAEALLFLEFISANENLEAHNVACAQIPAKKAVANDPGLLTKMPFAAPLIPILGNAQFIGFFNTDTFKELINGNFEEFIAGEFDSVEDALAALDEALNAAINH